jgi:hypothetical protein
MFDAQDNSRRFREAFEITVGLFNAPVALSHGPQFALKIEMNFGPDHLHGVRKGHD